MLVELRRPLFPCEVPLSTRRDTVTRKAQYAAAPRRSVIHLKRRRDPIEGGKLRRSRRKWPFDPVASNELRSSSSCLRADIVTAS